MTEFLLNINRQSCLIHDSTVDGTTNSKVTNLVNDYVETERKTKVS